MHRRKLTSHLRPGYTLVEMLLVLAILALIAAIAWPSMTRVYADLQLKDATARVQTEVAGTRVKAIDNSLAYQFRYEPGGRRFVVVPYERDAPAAQSPVLGQSPSESTGLPGVSGQLPEGLRFQSREKSLGTLAVAEGSTSLAQDWLAGLPDASVLASVQWSGPIVFYPDGSATDATFIVIDEKGQYLRVGVRALTGAVFVGDVQQESRI